MSITRPVPDDESTTIFVPKLERAIRSDSRLIPLIHAAMDDILAVFLSQRVHRGL